MLQEINQASETSDPRLLTSLASHDHPQVRQETADNTNTPVKALRLLAEDKDFDVVFAVAENPRTPNDLLSFLSYHTDQEIQRVAQDGLRRRQNGEISYTEPTSKEPVHGTMNTYRRHHCRCDECVAAHRQNQELYKMKRKALHQANIGNPPKHGTITGYRDYKCRCEACKEAGRVAERKRYQKRTLRQRQRI